MKGVQVLSQVGNEHDLNILKYTKNIDPRDRSRMLIE